MKTLVLIVGATLAFAIACFGRELTLDEKYTAYEQAKLCISSRLMHVSRVEKLDMHFAPLETVGFVIDSDNTIILITFVEVGPSFNMISRQSWGARVTFDARPLPTESVMPRFPFFGGSFGACGATSFPILAPPMSLSPDNVRNLHTGAANVAVAYIIAHEALHRSER